MVKSEKTIVAPQLFKRFIRSRLSRRRNVNCCEWSPGHVQMMTLELRLRSDLSRCHRFSALIPSLNRRRPARRLCVHVPFLCASLPAPL